VALETLARQVAAVAQAQSEHHLFRLQYRAQVALD
jgi:hypothetical protein